jgi:protein-tyrosine sulfotransferase
MTELHAPAPILILSCERSGSTLLRYMLDTHPEIACPGELVLGQFVRSLRLLLERTRGGGAGSEDTAAGWVRSEVNRTVHERMADYARARGKSRWAEKSPGNLEFLDELVWAFPEARFICLYRQSLDVVHSCLECSVHGFMPELAPYAARRLDNLVAAMLENWATKTARMVALERTIECCRVHYEALVSDPVATLDRVFAFLGLGWDQALLQAIFETPHDPGGGDFKIRSAKSIERDHIGTGAAVSRRKLAAVPALLQGQCADLHLELGYPLWSTMGVLSAATSSRFGER